MTRSFRLKTWKDTSPEEIRRFLGLIMGLVIKPSIELYWSKKTMHKDEFLTNIMTRDRFQVLSRFLHFQDNKDPSAQADRLDKIKPVIDSLLEMFQKAYTPGSKLVVDEYLIPFRGRLMFRQYIPSKSHKYGIKLYKLCTPDSYTWDFNVYSGHSSPLFKALGMQNPF